MGLPVMDFATLRRAKLDGLVRLGASLRPPFALERGAREPEGRYRVRLARALAVRLAPVDRAALVAEKRRLEARIASARFRFSRGLLQVPPRVAEPAAFARLAEIDAELRAARERSGS